MGHTGRTTLAEEIGRGLMRARRAMLVEARSRLERRGEDLLAWQALNQLEKHGPLAQNELAERTGQHPTGLSRLLTDLERAKCVVRQRDDVDRRRVRVAISRSGKARLAAGRPAVHEAVELVLEPLGTLERRALRDLLGRILDRA